MSPFRASRSKTWSFRQALPEDEREWVSQSDNVSFRPLMFNVTQGYFVNILRVRKTGVLSRHRHDGPVHAFVLKGRWYYLEHDWTATEGSYAHEVPGEVHTLYVPDDVPEMMTLFHVTGAYTYLDEQGKPVGHEDVFTKIEAAAKHYEAVGLARTTSGSSSAEHGPGAGGGVGE